MKTAPKLRNERERLTELKSYEILDTVPEIAFDEITELASNLCETPISLVSLIDGHRQWFKSHKGVEATETPRDISFCGHAIAGNDLFEVSNSLQDERFVDNPLVTGPHKVVFYAGVPLTNKSGFNLGTLCVIDHQPKKLTENQKKQLRILAKQVVAQMELRKSHLQLSRYLSELEKRKQMAMENAKLVAIGEMAAGIAHEINNPLAIINVLNTLTLSKYPKSEFPDIHINGKKIEATIERISKIIRGMKAVCRDGQNDPKQEFSIINLVEDALSICNEKIKNGGVKVIVDVDNEATVFCRGSELSQVLLNLISNAFDAINKDQNAWINISSSSTSLQTIISVKDSGLAADLPDKIMQPFFTTKEFSKGTGLGLSISKRIIESQGGIFRVSPDSINTQFDILLPKHR